MQRTMTLDDVIVRTRSTLLRIWGVSASLRGYDCVAQRTALVDPPAARVPRRKTPHLRASGAPREIFVLPRLEGAASLP